ITSFNERLLIWDNALNLIDEPNFITYLLRMGASTLASVDNDYIYILANYGLIFLLVNTLMYVFVLLSILKVKDNSLKALVTTSIIFSFLIGFQADTLGGWNYPSLLFFYVGLAIAIKK